MASIRSIRWAVKTGGWEPNGEEFNAMLRALSNDESTRIKKFRFQKDAKHALCGRMLLREAISSVTKCAIDDTCFGRNAQGKPFYLPDPSLPVNISHHGEWVVLAYEGHTDTNKAGVGVDVMELVLPKSQKNTFGMFQIFADSLTSSEWTWVKSATTEEARLERFYWVWTMKEAYMKALGIGLGFGLLRIRVYPLEGHRDGVRAALCMKVDDVDLRDGWTFECEFLDKKHIACVAYPSKSKPEGSRKFESLTPYSLMNGLPHPENIPNH